MEADHRAESRLPPAESVLAVCAHPDDESFGLGAVLGSWADEGATISVLSFTHGESSSLGSGSGDLHGVRRDELSAAASELGVGTVRLLGHPDGRLVDEPMAQLTTELRAAVDAVGATLLLVFDEGGVTGHPDHVRATAAALELARERGVPVLAWTLPARVAAALNEEFATAFAGRAADEIDLVVEVDRARQQRAVRCHRSQSVDNPVLWRRLELLGAKESLRWLVR